MELTILSIFETYFCEGRAICGVTSRLEAIQCVAFPYFYWESDIISDNSTKRPENGVEIDALVSKQYI